ncbi:hypothetical protein M5K25_008922 [Dendrobium thyrsiflorum]|uniref:Transmembrane protein n=1 Tax=Dendrobium thyrsiflorum TaxID=117978 RepID=A0ABD0V9N1_DENTH
MCRIRREKLHGGRGCGRLGIRLRFVQQISWIEFALVLWIVDLLMRVLLCDFRVDLFRICVWKGYLRTPVFLRVTCELKYFLSNWYQSKFWDQGKADFKKIPAAGI